MSIVHCGAKKNVSSLYFLFVWIKNKELLLHPHIPCGWMSFQDALLILDHCFLVQDL